MSSDEDDKPTVVIDLNALKKQKLKQEEDLANIVQELEFAVGPEVTTTSAPKPQPVEAPKAVAPEELDSENFAELFLEARAKDPEPEVKPKFKVILFDFTSDFFEKAKGQFPTGYDYHIAKTLPELTKHLSSKTLQIVVFNYDVNPKAVNQLTTQIKKKFPFTKTMIMARAISPEKAKLHAATPAGAHGYYQFPLDPKRVDSEFTKLTLQTVKKAS